MRKLISIKNISRKEWLEIRRKGIGGSDIAAICGLNPYKSPLMVYLDKTNQMPKIDEENIAMELGLELEPYLSKKFIKWIANNEEIDIKLKEISHILQHDETDYFIANIDRWFLHPQKDKCLVEFKTTSEFKRDQWKDEQIPDEYFLQIQWYLMITNWNYCYLAFLIGNRKFDVKVIPRNEKIIKSLKLKGIEFWKEFIEKNQPPTPIGLPSDEEALKILFSEEEKGKILEFDINKEKEIIKFIEKYDELKYKINSLEKEFNNVKQNLKFIMGDSELAIINNRKITYKIIEIKEHLVKEYSFRKLYIGKK